MCKVTPVIPYGVVSHNLELRGELVVLVHVGAKHETDPLSQLELLPERPQQHIPRLARTCDNVSAPAPGFTPQGYLADKKHRPSRTLQ